MRLKHVNGKFIYKNVNKYRINWTKKSRSLIQFKIKQLLQPYWEGHICYEEFPVYGSLLKVDLINMNRKIAIEVNGAQHDEFNKFFHNESRANYYKSIKRDIQKRKWLESNDFTIIEIMEKEIPELNKYNFKDFIFSKFNVTL